MAATAPTDDREFFYEGFTTPNGTLVPDDVFDVLAPRLGEAELRVLLYIIRRTFGFKKHSDAISLGQLTDGIRARDGRILDHGTGLSRKGVVAGIKGLLHKGIITVERRADDRGENHINIYSLRFKSGVVTSGNYGSVPATLPPVTAGTPQESVLQESVRQQQGGAPPGGREGRRPRASGVVASELKDPAYGRPDLYEQMKDLGVHHHTAGKLLREHDHLQIEQVLEFVADRLQHGWTPQESAAAWAVAAIRGRYELPAATRRAAEDSRQAQRQLIADEVTERERRRTDEELHRQRAAKLQAMGIEQNVDDMWQRAQAMLRERGHWSVAMALSYLKQVENGQAVLLVPGNLKNRLLPCQEQIAGALGEVAGQPLRLVLVEMA